MNESLIATSHGSVLCGMEAMTVSVRATPGDRPLTVAGLSTERANELRVRVASALARADLRTRVPHVHVDLAWADPTVDVPLVDAPIDTSALDLAVLAAVIGGQMPESHVPWTRYVGELALDGRVRAVRGAFTRAQSTIHPMVLPMENVQEIAVAERDAPLYVASHWRDLLKPLERAPTGQPFAGASIRPQNRVTEEALKCAKKARAVLLVGAQWTGKVIFARALTASEPMTPVEARESLAIESVAGLAGVNAPSLARPFRAPHHTASEAALIGGGARPRPGEVSLAHRGVLYLDEVTEFRRESLRELARVVRRGRSEVRRATFPARPYSVVLAASPLPSGVMTREACSPETIKRHEARLGEIAEMFGAVRIDL